MAAVTSVLVAHPERVYAESLALALRAHPRIDATPLATESEPLAAQLENADVALLAGGFCSDALRKGVGPQAGKAILLCPDSQLDGQLLLSALRAGARGLASTGDSLAALVAVLVGVAAGKPAISARITSLLHDLPDRPPSREPLALLTGRETGVLSLLATGATNREIAARLNVSEHTVAVHVSHILAKLGVSSRSRAAAFAIAHGLVPPLTTETTSDEP